MFILSCAASRNHRVQDKCNKTTMCSSLGPATKPARDFQGVSLSNKTLGNQRGDLGTEKTGKYPLGLALTAHIRFG